MYRDGFRLAYILGKELRFIYDPAQEFRLPLLVMSAFRPECSRRCARLAACQPALIAGVV
jgi:hypothetical protein